MSEGVGINMMNRKSIRVLITLVLALAILSAFGTRARAAVRGGRSVSIATSSSGAPKPPIGPMAGEPDFPNGGPLPPKTGSYPTGGNGSDWALRVQWLVRTWLGSVPKRFP